MVYGYRLSASEYYIRQQIKNGRSQKSLAEELGVATVTLHLPFFSIKKSIRSIQKLSEI